ncbi:MAG: ABC transporter permease, partial [SAR324 cluster bacterium]|nr:ABC transporter permease [SAR324 cluster bacterium]
MRLEPRSEVSPVRFILAPVAAVIASLLLCSGLILWSGASVFEAYWMMLTGSIGSSFALAETLSRATPLIFTGLAAAVAFRARFWNIGAEGQLYAGALMVTFLGTGEINIHEGFLPPILFLGSFAAGSLWLFLPSLIKIRFQVDEVVTTLLLNFVMLLLVSLLLEGP